MLIKIKEFFLGKPKAQEPVTEAPYKVEAPVTPAVVNPAVFPHLVVDGHGDVHEVKTPATPKKSPAKKAPVVKPAVAAKKPRAKKTTAK
jgi:hypothetical protein